MTNTPVLKQFIIAVVVIYLVMCFFSVTTANFILAIFLVTILPLIFLKSLFLNIIYKHSINIVPKSFVAKNNTIKNNYCTVAYTPDNKIVVMDSFEGEQMSHRIFTINKSDIDINRAWNRICRIFDNYTTLETLSAFFGYDCGLRVKPTEIKPPKKNTVEKPKTQQQTVNIIGAPQKRKEVPVDFIDMNSLDEQEIKQEEHKEYESVKLDELMTKYNKKINVNNVEAGELAILPGINIAMAKRIIEYRNLNGAFKNEQEFLDVADVKEHFAQKIRNMIVALPPEEDDDSGNFEGRIVDI